MERVTEIKKQNSKWEITTEHKFTHRFYEVDELGNFYRDGKVVNVKPDKRGYMTVLLIDDNGLRIRCKIQQIVFQTFNKNVIKDYYSVDHINRDAINNNISNLRLADRNTQYSNRENYIYKIKKVKCVNNGIIYKSCKDAESYLALTKNTVSRVARGERKSIHGYVFEFV